MRNSYQPIYGINESYTIAASGTSIIDIDLAFDPNTVSNMQLYFEQIYSSNTAGCSLNLTDGTGPSDPANTTNHGGVPIVIGGSSVPKYDSEGTDYTLNPLQNNSGTWSSITRITIVPGDIGRWLRSTLSNQTASTVTIKIYGDF